ncbi:hypothetical protein M422DRAFT_37185 [Sphaerobolus stellatus SS14]|uniref:Uncharacterized protein n=1 Tax=Sphaerobolus stellatus (strain SS14) TaxID=990650 RepID=A0A0C9U3Z0_SPHS4|nr:hypothetical protein M422DRAFT_37185 [Sphaerobolus stellatus SS14]
MLHCGSLYQALNLFTATEPVTAFNLNGWHFMISRTRSHDVRYLQALGATASASGKDLVSRLKMLNRQVYELVQYAEKPKLKPTSLPAKYLLTGGIEFSADANEDIEKRYEEEHFLSFQKYLDGYAEGGTSLSVQLNWLGKQRRMSHLHLPSYLLIHKWDNPNYMEDLKRADAYQYLWSQKV